MQHTVPFSLKLASKADLFTYKGFTGSIEAKVPVSSVKVGSLNGGASAFPLSSGGNGRDQSIFLWETYQRRCWIISYQQWILKNLFHGQEFMKPMMDLD